MPSRSIAGAAFIICDTFSSSVMRETKSSTRFSIGYEASRYGADGALVWPLVCVSDKPTNKLISTGRQQAAAQR